MLHLFTYLLYVSVATMAIEIKVKSTHETEHASDPLVPYTSPEFNFFGNPAPQAAATSLLDTSTSVKNSVMAAAAEGVKEGRLKLKTGHKPMTPDQFSDWLRNFYAQADKRRAKQIKIWEARDPLRSHFGPDGHYHPSINFVETSSKGE